MSAYRTLATNGDGPSHWNPFTIEISRAVGWKLGCLAYGRVTWGERTYHVYATPWFAIWI
jgi:hypothetical protein